MKRAILVVSTEILSWQEGAFLKEKLPDDMVYAMKDVEVLILAIDLTMAEVVRKRIECDVSVEARIDIIERRDLRAELAGMDMDIFECERIDIAERAQEYIKNFLSSQESACVVVVMNRLVLQPLYEKLKGDVEVSVFRRRLSMGESWRSLGWLDTQGCP